MQCLPNDPRLLRSLWLAFAALSYLQFVNALMSPDRKLQLRNLVKKTWHHGFGNYMEHAFPDDELRPLSCQGIGHDHENPSNHEVNDVLGDFAMTLIDSLDTFVVLRDHANFTLAVQHILHYIRSFDIDARVQVFETTIRVLGGLLSGHLFAGDQDNRWGYRIEGYQGELLGLAEDLARRMLPAFETSKTGIPYARINLRHGIHQDETLETCTAGAGSLLLEFGTLSRLLGKPVYENVARKAYYALWNRRSHINLFGNTINLETGHWLYGVSSIGAGIDSFYEYILKSYVLLQDDSFLSHWDEAYKSVMTYMRSPDGFWYRGVNMQTGSVATTTIDSLAAFWPGLQVLAGDVEAAIQSHMVYANLWHRYSGIPEVFDTHQKLATSHGYPLRPEFIESNYFLYRATKDEFYLETAERVILDLVDRCWVDCGLASIGDLRTGKLEDRMHSFMLSETLKYLYLTFDESNPINDMDEAFIFTTEGHILFIPDAHLMQVNQRVRGWDEHGSLERTESMNETSGAESESESGSGSRKVERKADTCAAFLPSTKSAKYSSALKLSVQGRTDVEYAKMLTGIQDEIGSNMGTGTGMVTETEEGTGTRTRTGTGTGSGSGSGSGSGRNSSTGSTRNAWNEYGRSEVPVADEYLIELLFTRSEEDKVEEYPSFDQVEWISSSSSSSSSSSTTSNYNDNNLSSSLSSTSTTSTSATTMVTTVKIKSLTGLKFSIRKRVDEDGYDVVKVGSMRVPGKARVLISDGYAVKVLRSEEGQMSERDRRHLSGIRVGSRGRWIERAVMMATFGPDVRVAGTGVLSVGSGRVELVGLEAPNEHGCKVVGEEGPSVRGKVVMVERGKCAFVEKIESVARAGAEGVLVINSDESLLVPTSDRLASRDPEEAKMDVQMGERSLKKEQESKLDDHYQTEEEREMERMVLRVPLLFANQETGTQIRLMIEKVGVDKSNKLKKLKQELGAGVGGGGGGVDDDDDNDKVWIEIVSDAMALVAQDVVINGYRLVNVILDDHQG